MSLEALITATLGPLVGNRIFPDVAPLDTPRPYITYQQIGGAVVDYTDNTVADHANANLQINVWSDTRLQTSALVAQVEAALVTDSDTQARAMSGPVSDYDEDLKRYGTRQDFTVWYPR
jgi:hypothetical protein